jgi:hypothetical protein
MKSINLCIIFAILLLVSGCRPGVDDRITEKIIYDVQIKNTDAHADWWQNNIPGPARDELVKKLMDGAKSGDVAVYDENGALISSEDASNIGIDISTMTFQRPEPPYEYFDTIVRSEINFRDITRIRFMEEWYFDDRHNLIDKNVIAMAPVVENYGPDGIFRGYEALFWIFNK